MCYLQRPHTKRNPDLGGRCCLWEKKKQSFLPSPFSPTIPSSLDSVCWGWGGGGGRIARWARFGLHLLWFILQTLRLDVPSLYRCRLPLGWVVGAVVVMVILYYCSGGCGYRSLPLWGVSSLFFPLVDLLICRGGLVCRVKTWRRCREPTWPCAFCRWSKGGFCSRSGAAYKCRPRLSRSPYQPAHRPPPLAPWIWFVCFQGYTCQEARCLKNNSPLSSPFPVESFWCRELLQAWSMLFLSFFLFLRKSLDRHTQVVWENTLESWWDGEKKGGSGGGVIFGVL